MDKDLLRELIERVEHAENEIHDLMCIAEETYGLATIAKRADTIMGKLENLKWLLIDKQRK